MLRISNIAVFPGLLFTLLLAGCSADSAMGARVFAVQGKFEWQSCEQLLAQRNSYTKRIEDLEGTMAKASRDAGGGFVNATVHQPTLTGFKAERELIAESMAKKGCPEPAARHTAQARRRGH
jgi:hypothetical protein